MAVFAGLGENPRAWNEAVDEAAVPGRGRRTSRKVLTLQQWRRRTQSSPENRQTKTRKEQGRFVVKNRRAEVFTRAETRRVGREQAGSEPGDQSKGQNQEISPRVIAGESCMGTKNNVAVRVEESGA